jgi:hypothetical protein
MKEALSSSKTSVLTRDKQPNISDDDILDVILFAMFSDCADNKDSKETSISACRAYKIHEG